MSDERIEAIQQLLIEMDAAKPYFDASRQSFAQGVAILLQAVENTAAPDNALANYGQTVAPFVRALRTLVEIWLSRQVPAGVEATEGLAAAREFFSQYLMRLAPDKQASERQAILATLAILDEEIERRCTSTSDSNDETANSQPGNIEWIKVEG